jgi:hypothetical protein
MSKFCYLIEKGTFYSCEPWTPICVCKTEEEANKYIENQIPFDQLYHKTKLPIWKN